MKKTEEQHEENSTLKSRQDVGREKKSRTKLRSLIFKDKDQMGKANNELGREEKCGRWDRTRR